MCSYGAERVGRLPRTTRLLFPGANRVGFLGGVPCSHMRVSAGTEVGYVS